MLLCILKAIFILVGAGFSIFYGLCYRELWFDVTAEGLKTELKLKDKGGAWRFWQSWLNCVDSAVGWIMAYYYTFHRAWSPTFPQVGDAVPILIALLGITGHLPFVLGRMKLGPPTG